MTIETKYHIEESVFVKCKYTQRFSEKKIVGIYYDEEGVSYIFDNKAMILNAISEKELTEMQEEKKEKDKQ